ncbi:MAG: hypothetical protein A3J74_10180 [Elusimicrobia bacterium RIFCSPHIGHO2_02_FULL_57_9]|nr:MAG: hypothetical protein A3J74_10180 [Elusimicrobia bacterium RIFCSPHIGHO2_02_FULL_57_9]
MKFVLAWLLSFPLTCAADQYSHPFSPKPLGILLLYEGSDPLWETTVDAIRRKLSLQYPVKAAAGLADRKELQNGVDALKAERVQKIVAVPLFLYSHSEIMDQNRFLLGLNPKAAKEHAQEARYKMGFSSAKPIQNKLPLAMTKALDDHSILGDILTTRAKSLSRNSARETVLLIGSPPHSKEDRQHWESTVNALAEQVKRKGGFQTVAAEALPINLKQAEREKAEGALRQKIRSLRSGSPVIVVPMELTRGEIGARIPKALNGLFIRYDGKPALPDGRIIAWAQAAAQEGAGLPDMRVKKPLKLIQN